MFEECVQPLCGPGGKITRLLVGGCREGSESGSPAARLAHLVDVEVLLFDCEEGVVVLQGAGELVSRGGGAGHAGEDEGAEGGEGGEGSCETGEEAVGGFEGEEELVVEDGAGGEGGEVADFFVVVVEGVVEGDEDGEVSGAGGGEGE
jgi:hypothetical protein